MCQFKTKNPNHPNFRIKKEKKKKRNKTWQKTSESWKLFFCVFSHFLLGIKGSLNFSCGVMPVCVPHPHSHNIKLINFFPLVLLIVIVTFFFFVFFNLFSFNFMFSFNFFTFFIECSFLFFLFFLNIIFVILVTISDDKSIIFL